MPREYPALISTQECGCMDQCVVEKTDTYDLIAEFYKKAAKRKTPVTRIEAGQAMPAWECLKHREERLNKAKQKGLF